MNKTLEYLRKIFTVISVAFINMFLSSLILSFLAYGRKGSEAFPLMMLFSMILSNILILILFHYFLKRKNKSLIDEFNLNKKIDFKYLLISIFIPLLIVLFSIGFTIVFPPDESSINNTTQTLTQYTGPWPYFVSILYPVFFAPVFEELIYRGIFGSVFNIFKENSRLNNLLFILSSVLIFGALHLQTTGTTFTIVTSFLFPAFSGIVFSYQYLKTKNILYPIIAHSVYNFIVILFHSI